MLKGTRSGKGLRTSMLRTIAFVPRNIPDSQPWIKAPKQKLAQLIWPMYGQIYIYMLWPLMSYRKAAKTGNMHPSFNCWAFQWPRILYSGLNSKHMWEPRSADTHVYMLIRHFQGSSQKGVPWQLAFKLWGTVKSHPDQELPTAWSASA